MVTLGIIGVVSAMTVPSLMQNYQRQSYVTQLHKVYNEFSQAFVRYQTDRNAINLKEAGFSSQNDVNSFIKSYFKVVKECESMHDCFAGSYKKINGTATSAWGFDYKSFILANGASIRPAYSPEGNKIINMALDINGPKGPNIVGRDLFWLYVYTNGLIDDMPPDTSANAPLSKDQRETLYSAYCLTTTATDGCFGKILNDNWEMNY